MGAFCDRIFELDLWKCSINITIKLFTFDEDFYKLRVRYISSNV